MSHHPKVPKPPVMHVVELVSNGDDFDRAGFEAALEYLSTGQAGDSLSRCREKLAARAVVRRNTPSKCVLMYVYREAARCLRSSL